MTMNRDPIFLLSETGSLQRVMRADYDSELLLQDLVDSYPELLAGEQISPTAPLHWLVIDKEVGIPDAVDASDRWALDILLVDNHSRPTLVEIKRSTDRRIRREVVGQMLDYAANAQLYWPVDRIRSLATQRYGGADNLDAEVARLLGNEAELASEEIDKFWTAVSENLRQGRVRLLFVADELPGELKRTIEFLNGQMPDVDVLGVEIPQYLGDSFKALVPRLVGQTELIRQSKIPPASQGKTTREKFFSAFGPDLLDFYSNFVAKAEATKGISVDWGRKNAIIKILPISSPKSISVLYLNSPGSNGQEEPALEFYLEYIASFGISEKLREALGRVQGIRQNGDYTLKMMVSLGSLQNAENAAKVFWDWTSDVLTPL
jgi:hypothetical protein